MAKHRVVAAIITAPAQLLEEADQPQLLACRPRRAENDAVAAGVVTSGGFGVSLNAPIASARPLRDGPVG